LQYAEGEKLDRALRGLLAATDDLQVSFALVDRLAGRGFDADIEAFIDRRLAAAAAADRQYVEGFRRKLGLTRLHVAVELRSPYLIDAALAAGTDVNARTRDGRTALHIAAAENDGGAVASLLTAKADADRRDGDGRTPMEVAALRGYSGVVRQLAGAQTGPLGFYSAVVLGKAERVKELLAGRPDLVKAPPPEEGARWTPLEIAAKEGHEATARVLLDAGADVEGARTWGSPLDWAAGTERPNLRLVRLLIDRGADVNKHRGVSSETPLHYAARSGNVEQARLLLEAKADLRAKDLLGRTPLDLAREGNHLAVARLLESAR
jgi:ankyrin repeat protein